MHRSSSLNNEFVDGANRIVAILIPNNQRDAAF
jgi:hypothetical protein